MATSTLSFPQQVQRAGSGSYILRDLLWGAFLFGGMLSEPFFGSTPPSKPFWFAAYFYILYFAAKNLRTCERMLRENLLIVFWPLLACFSGLWSLGPATSVYEGLQLFMTIMLALIFAYSIEARKQTVLIFSALFIAVLVSLLSYKLAPAQAIGWTGEFRGIYHHKNEMGIYSALLILASVCFLLTGIHMKMALLGLAGGAFSLYLTHSGTPIVSVLAALMLLPLCIVFRINSNAFKFFIGVTIVAGSALAAFLLIYQIDLFSSVLGSVGKDTTLTGRTVLWSFAYDAIEKSPWIGYGFKGWWDEKNVSVSILRYAIGQDLWYFHNVYLEVTVAFGLGGLALLVWTLLVALRRAINAYAVSPDAPSMWNLLYLVMLAIYSTAENPIFLNHSMHQFLLTVAFAGYPARMAMRKASRSRPAFPNRPAIKSPTVLPPDGRVAQG